MTRKPSLRAGSAVVAATSALMLSACLFGKDDATFTYRADVSGRLRPILAYDAQGNAGAQLGEGIEITLNDGGAFADDGRLKFWPSGENRSDVPRFLGLTRDSAYVLRVDDGLSIPRIEVVAAFAGQPCSFRKPRAYQVAGEGDTIRLAVTGTRLDRADTARFALLLDVEAALDEGRVDFEEPLIGSVEVTCPKP